MQEFEATPIDTISDVSVSNDNAEDIGNQNESLSQIETSVAEESEISTVDEDTAEKNKDEADELKNEVKRLREALAKKDKEQEEALRELGEFSTLFPDISVKQIPSPVWDSVQSGIPLCAAYALYEKKSAMAKAKAQKINETNASLSAGKAGSGTASEYFSPDEVRAMSQKQVRENYNKILESMRSWN